MLPYAPPPSEVPCVISIFLLNIFALHSSSVCTTHTMVSSICAHWCCAFYSIVFIFAEVPSTFIISMMALCSKKRSTVLGQSFFNSQLKWLQLIFVDGFNIGVHSKKSTHSLDVVICLCARHHVQKCLFNAIRGTNFFGELFGR